MQIVKSKKWANIEVGQRNVGRINMVSVSGGKVFKVYVTYRNSSHVMQKFSGAIGCSEAILEKISKIHKTDKMIVKYERLDGKFEYWFATVDMFMESELVHTDGLDKQRFVTIKDLKLNIVNLSEGVII